MYFFDTTPNHHFPKVTNVRDWIFDRRDTIKFYQTLHSYGQVEYCLSPRDREADMFLSSIYGNSVREAFK